MEIYTQGIMITRAIVDMWGVMSSNGKIYASNQLRNLEKRIAEPDAQVGCWATITYIEHKNINSRRKHFIRIFVNLISGDYMGEGSHHSWDNNRVSVNDATPLAGTEDKIAKIVVPRYLKKWEKKLKKEIV